MAIAHVATEYVFSDFLLKEPNQARYRSVRTELALDKLVTCVAVGLPLLLISLAFAQEVSVGEWRPSNNPSGATVKAFDALFLSTHKSLSNPVMFLTQVLRSAALLLLTSRGGKQLTWTRTAGQRSTHTRCLCGCTR